jgi:hypothetical protein
MDHTTISRRWLWKMIFMLGLLVAFGIYGLYDALHAYPKRGQFHAEHSEWKFLEALKEDNSLIHARAASSDPAARLRDLQAAGDKGVRSKIDEAQFTWLTSLKRIGKLDHARLADASGVPVDVQARFKTLNDTWLTSRSSPVPLAAFDIPMQWVFVAVGFGGAAWMLTRLLPVVKRKYSWDPVSKALTLPDGSTLTPGDIADFDKRQWKKFLIYLKIKPGHQPHGGKELKLDLYTHDKLEGWILDMERTAFPERVADSAGQPGVVATGTAAPAETNP